MNKSMSKPNLVPDSLGLRTEVRSNDASANRNVPLDPSTPLPGAAQTRERICDAPSDPIKPEGVESVDKGA